MNRYLSFILSFLVTFISILIIALKVFFPYHRIIAISIYGASWIPFIYSIIKQGDKLIPRKKQKIIKHLIDKHKPVLIWLVLLLLSGYFISVIFSVSSIDFLSTSEDELKEQIKFDMSLIPIYLAGQAQAYQDLLELQNIIKLPFEQISQSQKKEIIEKWAVFIDYALEFEKLKEVHKHFFQINYLKYPELNLRSFLIAYLAFESNYYYSLQLQKLFGSEEFLQEFLNEQNPLLGLPSNSYHILQQSTTHPETIIRLNAGYANLKFLTTTRVLDLELDLQLINRSEFLVGEIYRLLGENPLLFVDNPLDYFERKTFESWFPFQKGIAKGMSVVRTSLRENFIGIKELKDIKKRLEPGDIMVQRRNWYLTNVGLPGFWPHAALYLGNLDEMKEYFKGESILGGLEFDEYLSQEHPDVYLKLNTEDFSGYLPAVIEAKKEGVILTSLEESASADYLGVMRPKLAKSEKLTAILKSFTFYGRPYDFNFDFVTDNTLVCSELVYKSYTANKNNLNFELELTAGRLVITPNNIVKNFDISYGTENQKLDFVVFYDGDESQGTVAEKGVEEFRKSWKRPKWDILQK